MLKNIMMGEGITGLAIIVGYLLGRTAKPCVCRKKVAK